MIGIGDFDGKSRNTRKVCTRVGQKMFNGKKYAQEESGYYVCTTCANGLPPTTTADANGAIGKWNS